MQIETDCRGCCFALSGAGCTLGRAEKYIELGTKYEMVDGYYKFQGRFCSAKRSEEWAKAQENPSEAVNEAIKQPMDVIVVHKDGDTIEDLERTINSCYSSSLNQYGPVNVVVNAKEGFAAVSQWVRSRFGGTSQVWYVTRVMSEFVTDFYKAVDMGYSKVKASFYLAIASGLTAPKTLPEWLHNQVNLELRQLLLAYPAEGDWYVAATRIHKHLSGNDRDEVEFDAEGQPEPVKVSLPSLPAKVQYFADLTNNQAIIEQVELA